ncbi:hypothetical protein MS6204_03294 [Escherichia coli]|nr:hypothetical protein [Escherichia coli]
MNINDALTSILASKKYRALCPDTVRRILTEEWGRHKSPKQTVEAARTRLHGICGAYVTPESLKAAAAALSAGDVKKALSLHASTKERLAELDTLYDFIFSAETPAACWISPAVLTPWRYTSAALHPCGAVISTRDWGMSSPPLLGKKIGILPLPCRMCCVRRPPKPATWR